MGNRDRVRQLNLLRDTACGIGTRALKVRLNKLAKTDPLALAARLALEIEDANVSAKKYGRTKWSYRNYDKKQELILQMITLFKHQEWVYGVHKSEYRFERGVIYFELPGCEQVSWHYDHKDAPLPIYEKEWDGKRDSTLPKLLVFIETTFPEIINGKQEQNRVDRSNLEPSHGLFQD
jgi:hypothetical protein